MTYLITGATGDVGSKVVHQLIQRGERPRIFVRNAEKAQAQFGNQVDIRVGDLADAASLQRASEGVEKLFLVNSGPQIPVLDDLAAQAAKSAGIRHIVKLSSFDVEQKLAIGAWHEKGEAAIRASGIAFSFVRPTGFMSNLLAWAHSIRTESIVRSSTADGRRPFIHSEDIASVCLSAILNHEYASEAVPITGPESLTFGEVTAIISEATGRPLSYQAISDEEARERYSRISGSEEETEAHVALWRAIRDGRLAATTDRVERILGRKPIALRQWASENVRLLLN